VFPQDTLSEDTLANSSLLKREVYGTVSALLDIAHSGTTSPVANLPAGSSRRKIGRSPVAYEVDEVGAVGYIKLGASNLAFRLPHVSDI